MLLENAHLASLLVKPEFKNCYNITKQIHLQFIILQSNIIYNLLQYLPAKFHSAVSMFLKPEIFNCFHLFFLVNILAGHEIKNI